MPAKATRINAFSQCNVRRTVSYCENRFHTCTCWHKLTIHTMKISDETSREI
ncbi:hypothetical protein PGB90_004882 [Kerria lacca]